MIERSRELGQILVNLKEILLYYIICFGQITLSCKLNRYINIISNSHIKHMGPLLYFI